VQNYGPAVLPLLIGINWLALSAFAAFFVYCCSVVSESGAERSR